MKRRFPNPFNIIVLIAVMVLLTGTVSMAAINPPEDFINSIKTNTTFTLTWTNAATADSTMIYVNDAWVAQLAGTVETYQYTGGTPGTTYTLIYAIADSAGVTANSDTLSIQLYYPENHGVAYNSTSGAVIKGYFADSWSTSKTASATIAGTDQDSTTVIIPFDYTSLILVAAGDSVACKVYFYGGICDGPFYVTLQDSLEITGAGVFRKTISWGPDPHGYAVFVGQTDNGSDQTVINNIIWTLRKLWN